MFKIGDKILCIDDTNWHGFTFVDILETEVIKCGRVYTIREIYYCDIFEVLTLRLEEIICPIHPFYQIECSWDAKRFKKIDYDKGSLKSKEKTCNKNKINV